MLKHPEYQMAESWDMAMNPTRDNRYFAEVDRDDLGMEITVLDSFHQGVTIVLRPNGTYSVHPTGG